MRLARTVWNHEPVTDVVTVSAGGAELVELAASLAPARGARLILGLAGAPGSGKSMLALTLTRLLGPRAACVPLDGFHLAEVELDRQGLRARKGAPETFDVHGYAALLDRLRSRPEHPVYAPRFDRRLEQPLAGAIAVPHQIDTVVTEGNYLLLDDPAWRAVRDRLDVVWFVCTEHRLRVDRLVARHVEFGKDPDAARAWVTRVDEPNARMVDAGRDRADVCLDLTAWVAGAV
jgi:pantothenate kinase